MENSAIHSTFLNLYGEVLSRLENPESRNDCIEEILASEFDSKMSELDYVHYKFLKALTLMYNSGFEKGSSEVGEETGKEPNQLTIGTFLNRKISNRKNISDNFILKITPIIKDIRRGGAKSYQEVARKLTELGVKTMAGNYGWYPATVRDLEVKRARRVEELKGLKGSIEEQIASLE